MYDLLWYCLLTDRFQGLLFSLSPANDTMYDCIKARQSAVSNSQLITIKEHNCAIFGMCWKLLLLLPIWAAISSRVREDGRCGSDFPLEDGSPSVCDPYSSYFCCSPYGWCGNSYEHCKQSSNNALGKGS